MVDAIKGLAPKDQMNLAESIKVQASNANRRDDTAEVVIGIDGSVKPAREVARVRHSEKHDGPAIDLGAHQVHQVGPVEGGAAKAVNEQRRCGSRLERRGMPDRHRAVRQVHLGAGPGLGKNRHAPRLPASRIA